MNTETKVKVKCASLDFYVKRKTTKILNSKEN